MDNEEWICALDHLHTTGRHCPTTGQQPPWGCPCAWCEDEADEAEHADEADEADDAPARPMP